MRFRGLGGVARRARRFVPGGRRDRALILLYHRITESPSDPWSMSVTPRRFTEHMEVLRDRFRPLPLRELTGRLTAGAVEPRSVAVTFDDGYADNLYTASPILARYAVPATVFLTVAHVGTDRLYWWDELDALLLAPGSLPPRLDLEIGRRTHSWEIGTWARYGEDDARRFRGWRAWESPPTRRHALYAALYPLVQRASEEERQEALRALRRWAGGTPAHRPFHRILSRDDVRALDREPLVELSAHTVTHPVLGTLPAAVQSGEIARSRAWIEEVSGGAVTSFSYPFGRAGDYTAETVALVRAAGFSCACTNVAGPVTRGTDRFLLPRTYVEDWDGDGLIAVLEAQLAD